MSWTGPITKVTCNHVVVDKPKVVGSGGRLADCREAPVAVLSHVLATPLFCTTNKSYTRRATSIYAKTWTIFDVSCFELLRNGYACKKKTRDRFLPVGILPCQPTPCKNGNLHDKLNTSRAFTATFSFPWPSSCLAVVVAQEQKPIPQQLPRPELAIP